MEPIENRASNVLAGPLVGRVVLLGLRAPRRLPRRLGLLRLGRRLGRRFRVDLGGLGRRLCLDRRSGLDRLAGLDRRGGLDRLGLLGRLRPAGRATAPSRRGSGRADSLGSSLQALLLLPLTVPAPTPNRPRASSHVERLDQPAVARGVGPRVVAASAAVSLLGDPHLLDRRPVVRGPLGAEEVGRRTSAGSRCPSGGHRSRARSGLSTAPRAGGCTASRPRAADCEPCGERGSRAASRGSGPSACTSRLGAVQRLRVAGVRRAPISVLPAPGLLAVVDDLPGQAAVAGNRPWSSSRRRMPGGRPTGRRSRDTVIISAGRSRSSRRYKRNPPRIRGPVLSRADCAAVDRASPGRAPGIDVNRVRPGR